MNVSPQANDSSAVSCTPGPPGNQQKGVPRHSIPQNTFGSTTSAPNQCGRNLAAAMIMARTTQVQCQNAVHLEVCEDFTMDRHSFRKLVVQGVLGFSISQLDAIFALLSGRIFEIIFTNYWAVSWIYILSRTGEIMKPL